MRCQDVSRAIAAPDGAISVADLKAHLAACPSCARQAERAKALDRLWEATRLAPPSPAAWDMAWARIEQQLAAPESVTPAADDRPRRVPIRAGFGLLLAAAAALLVALNLPEARPIPTVPRPAPIRGRLDVAVGQTVLYHVDSGAEQVIQSNQPIVVGDTSSVFAIEPGLIGDDFFVFFGIAEMLPEQLASAEDRSPFDPLSP